ncbi:MAG: toxin-antitoxin system [Betaproteobacteria bacterium]|nr:toxin-antitoxin system [Betaproteobacteria bacterium]
MPTLTVRQLEDDVYQSLKAQAESSGRSMEAEVRNILAAAVRGRTWWVKWVEATEPLRGDALFVPPRSKPREIGLS